MWTVNQKDFSCKNQVAVVVGGMVDKRNKLYPGAEVYPHIGNKSLLPPMPDVFAFGDAAYISGSLIFCGGDNSKDGIPTSACYKLTPPNPHWEKTFPLLQAVDWPSGAVIENGTTLWVLGGVTTDRFVQNSTQLVRLGQPTRPGPRMTEGAVAHCSSVLQDGSVIVTGGRRRAMVGGSTITEVFNFTTMKWARKANMKQGRMLHTCSQVWLESNSTLAEENGILSFSYPTPTSVLSIVVAGGELEFKKTELHMFLINQVCTRKGEKHPQLQA